MPVGSDPHEIAGRAARARTLFLRSYWNRVADEICRRGGVVAGDDTPFDRYKREKFLRCFLGSMLVEGMAVLEVGCGPGGNLSELIMRRPRRLVGCDISPKMVKLAQRTGVEVVLLDGTRLPFGEREFDLVYTVTVLQHNPEIDELVAGLCRVSGQTVELIEDVAAVPVRSGSYFRRTVDQYSEACHACGFELVGAEALGTAVSEHCHHTLRRFLDRHERGEGERVRLRLRALERILLPVTRRMDDRSTSDEGLTRMIFQRSMRPAC
jgi:SAM-dependent methyltransferase